MTTRFTQFGAIALLLVAGATPAIAQDAKATEVLAKTRRALGDKKVDGLKTFSA